jgi:hypothetical protein
VDAPLGACPSNPPRATRDTITTMARQRKNSMASDTSVPDSTQVGKRWPASVTLTEMRALTRSTCVQELSSMYDYLAKVILLGPSGAGKSVSYQSPLPPTHSPTPQSISHQSIAQSTQPTNTYTSPSPDPASSTASSKTNGAS